MKDLSLSDISFRRFESEDISACARLARDAWPAGPAVASKELELTGMEGYVKYSRGASNWAEVAHAEDAVVGFLLGRIDGYPGDAPKRSAFVEIPSMLRSLLDSDRSRPRLLSFVWSLVLTDLKVMLNTPSSDAAIEMFIVDTEHRGVGIGSALMDRFLSATRAVGGSTVTVYTDDRMSDWRFYDRRGFKRVATFRDNITSHYSGEDSNGIVFLLRLGQ